MENLQDMPFTNCDDLLTVLVFRPTTRAWQGIHEDLNYRSLHVLKNLRSAARRSLRPQTYELNYRLILPEILYEVLGHLHPLDLYNMAHASKHFRALLSPPSSRWLWDVSFERNPPTPACPADMPPLKWANLLFGRLKCQDCHGDSEPYPNMAWRRRLCWDCAFDRTFDVIGGTSTLNSVEAQIEREGVRQSCYDAASYQDVQRLADRIGAYSRASRRNGESANIHLRNLETDLATKDIVASIYETSRKCGDWVTAIENELDVDKANRYHRIVETLSKRLVKSGHARPRVRELFDIPGFGRAFVYRALKFQTESLRVTKRYIRHNWPVLQKQLEALLAELHRRELYRQHPAVVARRRNDVQRMWSDYLNSLNAASQCVGTPDILLSEPFVTMINDPSDDEIDGEQATKALAAFADRWLPRTMEDLFALEASKCLLYTEESHRPPHAYSINSAASVFSCPESNPFGSERDCKCLIGWSAAVYHPLKCVCCCFPEDHGVHPLKVDARGCAAASSLLDLLGLDPPTTLPADMDIHREKFICLGCVEETGHSTSLSWRDCIWHFMERGGSDTHFTPSWELVPSTKTLDT
ncbi:hypothetical protein LshimejAT787_1402390 [Lyophyllum shimeji]|uniref:F-box domain-containing protein n=1 Tax=Lyophyllum shimeji TaxID=47721 RepID=A0A9P3PYU1_LYOSH|nr:hypothetical protein LshimejAT787_1402390 [Lyophyllum shimeji]